MPVTESRLVVERIRVELQANDPRDEVAAVPNRRVGVHSVVVLLLCSCIALLLMLLWELEAETTPKLREHKVLQQQQQQLTRRRIIFIIFLFLLILTNKSNNNRVFVQFNRVETLPLRQHKRNCAKYAQREGKKIVRDCALCTHLLSDRKNMWQCPY